MRRKVMRSNNIIVEDKGNGFAEVLLCCCFWLCSALPSSTIIVLAEGRGRLAEIVLEAPKSLHCDLSASVGQPSSVSAIS
jgi:hypothetical protein